MTQRLKSLESFMSFPEIVIYYAASGHFSYALLNLPHRLNTNYQTNCNIDLSLWDTRHKKL